MRQAGFYGTDVGTWDLVDPDLRPFFEAAPSPGLSPETLPGMRAMMAGAPRTSSESGRCWVEERSIAGPRDTLIRLLIFRRRERIGAAAGLLHFHPGGWVLGSPEMSTDTLIGIVEAFDCVIVSVDYRLAPEHPFPAAADDGWATLHWLVDQADQLGIDRSRLGLIGESAGANISAGLVLRARDQGGPALAIQSLVYPALDDRAAALPEHPHAGKIGLGMDSMRFAWAALLGCEPGGDGVSPYAAPARADDLAGLPPAFLAIGTLDPFVEENLEFARRLIRAGVPTELHVYPGAPHAFDRVAEAAVTRAMRRDRIASLKRALSAKQAR